MTTHRNLERGLVVEYLILTTNSKRRVISLRRSVDFLLSYELEVSDKVPR